MEGTRAVLALFAALVAATAPVGGNISVSVQSDQLSNQPQLKSTVTLTCTINEQPFYQVNNVKQWLKQQYGGTAWLDVTNLSPRYVASTLKQTSGNEVKYTLTITDFQPADAGTYRCSVNAVVPAGKLTDDSVLSAGLQAAAVLVSTDATYDSGAGAYIYDSTTTTRCTVSDVGAGDVIVQAIYNGADHLQEFTVDRQVVLEGSTVGMKTVRQTITLSSTTFRPLTRTAAPLSCIALAADDKRELGRGSLQVALKTLPEVSCIQSGDIPAYLSDLNVMITCTAQHYEWHPTSRFVYGFTALENGNPTHVVVDGSVEKHGRTKVDDMQGGKHSLHINRVTSDVAMYPEYNVSLLEEDQVLTSSTFTLSVLSKGRSSQFTITGGATVASASSVAVLLLSLVASATRW